MSAVNCFFKINKICTQTLSDRIVFILAVINTHFLYKYMAIIQNFYKYIYSSINQGKIVL